MEQAASPHSQCFQLIGLARIFAAPFDRHEPVPRMNGAGRECLPQGMALRKCPQPQPILPIASGGEHSGWEIPGRL
jgi:hypothetical protein